MDSGRKPKPGMDPLNRPPPCPGECMDFLPRKMWPIYWKMFPNGTALPAEVPRSIWYAHFKANYPEEYPSPPPPKIWANYWFKFDDPELRRGTVNTIPDSFWHHYLAMFPRGHEDPTVAAKLDFTPLDQYSLIRH